MNLTPLPSTASSPTKGEKGIEQEPKASSENRPSSTRRGHRRVVSCVSLEEMGLNMTGLSEINPQGIDLLVIPTVLRRSGSTGAGTSPSSSEKKIVSWASPESKPKEPAERVEQAARPTLNSLPRQRHYSTL